MWLDVDVIGERYKLLWGSHKPQGLIYEVDRKAVDNQANITRESLRAVCEKCDSDRRIDALIELARSGQDLYDCLFETFKEELEPNIQQLKNWIAFEYDLARARIAKLSPNLPQRHPELEVQASSIIHIPWGLVFEGAVPDKNDVLRVGELAAFEGFWALRYRLSVVPRAGKPPESEMDRRGDNFGVLSLINSEVKAQIRSNLSKDEFDRFCNATRGPIGEANNYESCESALSTADKTDVLIHFLGHHRPNELDLGGQVMKYGQFSNLLKHHFPTNKERRGLLFINGCETACGDSEKNLKSYSQRSTLFGAVALESTVSPEFAALFARCFLDALRNEEVMLGDLMERLHHKTELWPQSLAYGCYAQPSYRITKATTTTTLGEADGRPRTEDVAGEAV